MEEDSQAGMINVGSNSRGRGRRGKSRRREETPLDDFSSSSGMQSFGDFGFVAPFEGSQGKYPLYDYQQIKPPRSSRFFDYVVGGSGNNNEEGDNGSYDHARRSTMWRLVV
jgi:hypothetical protein